MSLPHDDALDATLHVFLAFCGGMAWERQVLAPLASFFQITDAELREKMKDGRSKWPNSCEWSKERLAKMGYVYRHKATVDGLGIVAKGLWVITPEGHKKAERVKTQFGQSALSHLETLAAPIKRENDDPLFDLL